MKKIRNFMLVVLLFSVPVLLSAQDKDKDKDVKTVKYATSIHCEKCVNKVMSSLPQDKGIKDVKCDLATKEVTVTYMKDKSNPNIIKKDIENLGFTAKLEKEPNNSMTKNK